MYTDNSIFNSPYSTSNPFMTNFQNNNGNMDQNLAEMYSKLEALKASSNANQQQPQKTSVFTEISEELKNMTDDEKAYIFSTKEYQTANAKYQDAFSVFLVTKFANEFLQNNQRTMEELLLTIRNKKDQYRNKFADDVAEIRNQNKSLADKNAELAKSNSELQEQLKAIQERLSGANNL